MIYWLFQYLQDRWRGIPYGALRSTKWPAVEKAFKAKFPTCIVCMTDKQCEVHHVEPFHLNPSKELLESNLITLCRPHHYLFGHFMNWSSFNNNVRADAILWQSKITNRP